MVYVKHCIFRHNPLKTSINKKKFHTLIPTTKIV